MENWQQDWVKNVEAAATSLEKFFQDANKEIGSRALSLLELTDEMAEEIEQAIAPAIDQLEAQFIEWLDPFLEIGAELESFLYDMQWLDQISDFTDISADLNAQHPICRGCRHYHGEVYNGTPFICAMHPYGIVDGAEQCADKEASSSRYPQGVARRLPFRSTDASEDDF